MKHFHLKNAFSENYIEVSQWAYVDTIVVESFYLELLARHYCFKDFINIKNK